jgi:hypothetical protein
MRMAASLPIASALIALLFAAGTFAGHAQQPAPDSGSAPAPAPKIDMTPVKPESVGFSPDRLDRLHAAIQEEIDQKHLAGAVTILARHGKIVDYRTYGMRDLHCDIHDQGHHLPRLLHDQASDRRGHDDPLRRGQVAAVGPNLQISSPSSRTSRSSTASMPTAKCSSPTPTTRLPCTS